MILLIYHTTPQATIEMRPDKLFLHQQLWTCHTLVWPNLFTTVEKHQFKQKSAHDNSKPLVLYTKGETVLVHNKGGTPKWMTGKILQQKGPVSYLLRVGSRVRYCHTDRLLKSNVLPDENVQVVHNNKRHTGLQIFHANRRWCRRRCKLAVTIFLNRALETGNHSED